MIYGNRVTRSFLGLDQFKQMRFGRLAPTTTGRYVETADANTLAPLMRPPPPKKTHLTRALLANRDAAVDVERVARDIVARRVQRLCV